MRFLLFFLAPVQALALTCFDSSSGLMASVVRDEAKLHFRFSAGRGYESIPQVEGPISQNDLKMIRFQIETLKEIGSAFEISIPIEKCDLQKADQGLFACYQEGAVSGKNLQYSALTSFRTKQMHAFGEFEIQTFRMLMGKEDRFFFAMPFPARACTGKL